MASVYEIVTERIVAALEAGVIPWRRPWTQTLPPRNLASGKPYRGINVALLSLGDFGSPYWLTYRQATERGGHVRKGEKGSPVVFWKILEDTEDGEKRAPLLRYYTVFNAEQCEGIEVPQAGRPIGFDPIAEAERILANLPTNSAPIRHGGDRACYHPTLDVIDMPARERFTQAAEYYCTTLHELVHSTGHSSRLDRRAVMAAEYPDHATAYGREELVAEMGAAYLCAQAGILPATLDNSAAYLGGWARTLRGDSRLVVQAAAAAQKAADWLTSSNSQAETQQEAEAA